MHSNALVIILPALLQEIISTYARLYAGDLNVRGSKRLANVLTLFQVNLEVFCTAFIVHSKTLGKGSACIAFMYRQVEVKVLI